MRRLLLLALLLAPASAAAADITVPVLVPLTGFLALEGSSQRNGALLALQTPPAGLTVHAPVTDTGTAPEGALTAFDRATEGGGVPGVVASMLGTQMLALMPVAKDAGIPLVTISGTAGITEQGNPYVFRFFPGDPVRKIAQIRYALDVMKMQHPALIGQSDAYGQSGLAAMQAALAEAGVAPVFADQLDNSVKDMAPVLAKARAAGADGLLVQLHSGPTALLLKAAAAMGLGLPVISGSGLDQPSTAALLEPAELKGVCVETNAAPAADGAPDMAAWTTSYRAAFHTEPDGFALAQYDGARAMLQAIAAGADTPAKLAQALAAGRFHGLAMDYYSDGKGNMAHSAVVVCFDGATRVPHLARRYDAIDAKP
ncbi:MAG: ABC transporter substrate-binding protein [Acetobacteraceae bacterium]